MRNIVTSCILYLASCILFPAHAQRISDLVQTNQVYGTNRLPVLQQTAITNGTRGVTVHNLLGASFLSATTWSTNVAALTTQTLFTVTVPTANAILFEARAALYESTGTNGGAFDQSVMYANSIAMTRKVGLIVTNMQQLTTNDFGLLWATNSITNVTLSAYGTGNMTWRAALRTLNAN